MTMASQVLSALKRDLTTLAIVTTGRNSAVFTVRGWSFAIVRNGEGHWDILGSHGNDEAVPQHLIAMRIHGYVINAEADNAGWNFDPEELEI